MYAQDLARARSALTNTLAVTGPILNALQEASKVLDTVANSEVYRNSLERQVSVLTNREGELQSRVAALAADALEREQAADAQITAIRSRVALAQEESGIAVLAATDSMSLQIATAIAEATDALQAIAKVVQDARNAANAEIAVLATSTAAAKAEHDALAKKLEALKANASKVAAALGA